MRSEIAAAVKTCMAIAVGVVPLGLAFGVLMVQTGFDWWWTPVFSIVIYAGSMEFLAISMVTGGVTPGGRGTYRFHGELPAPLLWPYLPAGCDS